MVTLEGPSPAGCTDHLEMENSPGGRHELRSYLEKRRSSLTPREYLYVQQVCDHGHDDQIDTIHSKLRDNNIFPEDDELAVEGEIGDHDCLTPVGSLTSSPSFVSDQRQKILEDRKSNCMVGKLWMAHQTGLFVSSESSRRSLLSRGSSLRSLSSSGASCRSLSRQSSSVGQSSTREPRMLRSGSIRGSNQDLVRLRSSRRVGSRSGFFAIGTSIRSLVASRPGASGPNCERNQNLSSQMLTPRSNFQRSSRDLISVSTSRIQYPCTMSDSNDPELQRRLSAPSRLKVTFADLPDRSSEKVNENGKMETVRDEKKEDEFDHEQEKESKSASQPKYRSLFTREASVNNYEGAGVEVEEDLTTTRAPTVFRRPVFMRKASVNFYNGEGIEIADWETSTVQKEKEVSYQVVSRMESLISTEDDDGEATSEEVRCLSFDETMNFERTYRSFMKPSIHRSLSDSDLAESCDRDTWLIERYEDSEADHFDTWKVLDTRDDDNSYPFDYFILGTSADDVNAQPHVLSPPLMESLQEYLPFAKRGESFWLKYSLVRNGASMLTFLQLARGAMFSLLAIETVDGDVFGAFTTEPWRKNWNTFGGSDSFLWKMRHSRKVKCHSIIEQAQKESEIIVYPYTFENDTIQLCTNNRIAVGGGIPCPGSFPPSELGSIKDHEWGFGLSLSSDLLEGTSSPCITFGSPSLSSTHSDGSIFEVVNVELWTFTPCISVEEAERLELGNLFFETHRSS